MATADGTASINCRTALRPAAAATRLGYWMVASGSGVCTFSTSRRQSVGETRRRNNIGYLKMTGYGMDYVESCARNYVMEPNQAMQRTASRAAIHLLRVCHSPVGCVGRFAGVAVADLVSR